MLASELPALTADAANGNDGVRRFSDDAARLRGPTRAAPTQRRIRLRINEGHRDENLHIHEQF